MIGELAAKLKKRTMGEKAKALETYRQLLLRGDTLTARQEQELTDAMSVLGRTADHLEADAALFAEMSRLNEVLRDADPDVLHGELKQVRRKRKELDDFIEAERERLDRKHKEDLDEVLQQDSKIDRQIKLVKDAKGQLPQLRRTMEETFGVSDA